MPAHVFDLSIYFGGLTSPCYCFYTKQGPGYFYLEAKFVVDSYVSLSGDVVG